MCVWGGVGQEMKRHERMRCRRRGKGMEMEREEGDAGVSRGEVAIRFVIGGEAE